MLRTPSWERVDEGTLRSPHKIAVRSWLGCDSSIKLNQSLQVNHTSELLGTRDSSFGNQSVCLLWFQPLLQGRFLAMRSTGFFPIPCSAICHSSVAAV